MAVTLMLTGFPTNFTGHFLCEFGGFLIGHTLVTRKPLSWLLFAAEMANIRYRSGLGAIAERKASASSTMPSHVRGKKKT